MLLCVTICIRLVCRVFVFFFQAEDGIRDLVRSRGLGDVYKRQLYRIAQEGVSNAIKHGKAKNIEINFTVTNNYITPVSYTHLTLPTSDLV